MSDKGKFVDLEVRGGLGDVLIYFHRSTAWEDLEALGPNDRARLTLISHNPYADELLKWHPKRDQIEIIKSRAFVMEYDKVDLRRSIGVPDHAPVGRPGRHPTPIRFYPSPEDLAILDAELPKVPFIVLAPTASGMEIENRDIPAGILKAICEAALRRSIPVVWIGRTYQGPHAPKRNPDRLKHSDIIDFVDRLSVPGTCEVVKRCQAGVFAHSAMLQLAWVERRPNFVLYPPKYKHVDFDNPSPFSDGKDFPETTRMLFSEFKPSDWDKFLTKYFNRGNAPMNSPYDIFHPWYAPGGQGSGGGSTPEYTTAWRHFIEGYIRGAGVRSVLDFGCGDWQFSKMINWGDTEYHGVDIVPSLIGRLTREYGRRGVSFSVVDPINPNLPSADLLITKDVLQHLPNEAISRLLVKFSCAKTWMLINDRPSDGQPSNLDAPVGGYREIDFSKPPFSLKGKEIFQFGPPWRKVVFLVKR